jgi:hypothetical protein
VSRVVHPRQTAAHKVVHIDELQQLVQMLLVIALLPEVGALSATVLSLIQRGRLQSTSTRHLLLLIWGLVVLEPLILYEVGPVLVNRGRIGLALAEPATRVVVNVFLDLCIEALLDRLWRHLLDFEGLLRLVPIQAVEESAIDFLWPIRVSSQRPVHNGSLLA